MPRSKKRWFPRPHDEHSHPDDVRCYRLALKVGRDVALVASWRTLVVALGLSPRFIIWTHDPHDRVCSTRLSIMARVNRYRVLRLGLAENRWLMAIARHCRLEGNRERTDAMIEHIRVAIKGLQGSNGTVLNSRAREQESLPVRHR